jgi:hypothetical protein
VQIAGRVSSGRGFWLREQLHIGACDKGFLRQLRTWRSCDASQPVFRRLVDAKGRGRFPHFKTHLVNNHQQQLREINESKAAEPIKCHQRSRVGHLREKEHMRQFFPEGPWTL